MKISHVPIDMDNVVTKREEAVTTPEIIKSALLTFNVTTAVFLFMQAVSESESQAELLLAGEGLYSTVLHMFNRDPNKMIADLNSTLAWVGFPQHITEEPCTDKSSMN